MGKINFTKRSIETLPIPKEKRATHYDLQVRGLGILVQPSGHRSFFWFRKVRGIPTWRTIGAFPEWSIEQARTEANKLSANCATWKQNGYDGDNPFERQTVPTFDELVKDYTERHIKAHASRPERAAKNVGWMVNKYLASWRNQKVTAIRKAEVLDLHARVGKESREARSQSHYSVPKSAVLLGRRIRRTRITRCESSRGRSFIPRGETSSISTT